MASSCFARLLKYGDGVFDADAVISAFPSSAFARRRRCRASQDRRQDCSYTTHVDDNEY